MAIRYKEIIHERVEDAPFIGALICGISCSRGCTDCINQHLKDKYYVRCDSGAIINRIKKNPINEGIIFAGLEWTEQPLELLELAQKASDAKLKIMIYTGYELDEFYARIGKAVAEKKGYKFDQKNPEHVNLTIFHQIGLTAFNYFIKGDYYVKTGRYDADKTVDNNIQFGVKLATSNQKIHLIKGENNVTIN